MGFWKPDMQELDRAVRLLEGATYEISNGRAKPNTAMHSGIEEGWPDAIGWADLTAEQRAEVLVRCFDWTQFEPEQVDQITANIANGLERPRWFEGIEMAADTKAWHEDWLRFQLLSPEQQVHADWNEMTQGMAEGYHTSPIHDPFGQEDGINICAPDGRSMAFVLLSDNPHKDHSQANANAKLIVDALNAHQPRHIPGKNASTVELAARLFGDGAGDQQQGPEHHQESQQHERGGREP